MSLIDAQRELIDEDVSAGIAPENSNGVKHEREAPLQEHTWSGDRADLIERARRYLAGIPGAIDGQGGDAHTFRTAVS